MAYQRKTQDVYELEGHYGHGWEYLCAEFTLAEARERRREYQENEGGTYRLRTRREAIRHTQQEDKRP